jgi:hypothetical protein
VGGYAPPAPEDSMRRRLQSGASGRPLNFTVRHPCCSTLSHILALPSWPLGVVAFVTNRRASKVGPLPPSWHSLHRWRWPLMSLLAVAAILCVYPVTSRTGEHYRLWGFPFTAAAFDSRGLDYVSPLSPLLIGFDVLHLGSLAESVPLGLARLR